MSNNYWARKPNYAGYISASCRSCGGSTIGSAIKFKRNNDDQVLCPSCHGVCLVNAFDSQAIDCAMCDDIFVTTNPSRRYCGRDCRKKMDILRREANKIRTGKRRKRAVKEIYTFLNG